MLRPENLPKIELLPVTKVEPGHILANLGRVIEKTEYPHTISFVIMRMKQKQVLNFNKNLDLIIIPPEYYNALNNE